MNARRECDDCGLADFMHTATCRISRLGRAERRLNAANQELITAEREYGEASRAWDKPQSDRGTEHG